MKQIEGHLQVTHPPNDNNNNNISKNDTFISIGISCIHSKQNEW